MTSSTSSAADSKIEQTLKTLQGIQDPSTAEAQALAALKEWQSAVPKADGTVDGVSADNLLQQVQAELQNQDGTLTATGVLQSTANQISNAYNILQQGPQTSQSVEYQDKLKTAFDRLKDSSIKTVMKADSLAVSTQKILVEINGYLSGLGLGANAGTTDPGGSVSQQIADLKAAIGTVDKPTTTDQQALAGLNALQSAWGGGSSDPDIIKSAKAVLSQVRGSLQSQSGQLAPATIDSNVLSSVSKTYQTLKSGVQTAQAVALEAALEADAEKLAGSASGDLISADTQSCVMTADVTNAQNYLNGLGLGSAAGSLDPGGSIDTQISQLAAALATVASPTDSDTQAKAGLASLSAAWKSSKQDDDAKTSAEMVLKQIRAALQGQTGTLSASSINQTTMGNLTSMITELANGVQTATSTALEEKLLKRAQDLSKNQPSDLVSADLVSAAAGNDIAEANSYLNSLGLGASAGQISVSGSIDDQIGALQKELKTVGSKTQTDDDAVSALADLKAAWQKEAQNQTNQNAAENTLNQIRSALQAQDNSINLSTMDSNAEAMIMSEYQYARIMSQSDDVMKVETALKAAYDDIASHPSTNLMDANAQLQQVSANMSTIHDYLNQLGSFS